MRAGMIDMESNTTLVQCYPAHEAVPEGDGPFPAVVVAHDRFGLSPHIRGIANRLAWTGFYALAPNFYALPTSVAEAAPEIMRPSAPSHFEHADDDRAQVRSAVLSDERAEAIFRQAIGYAVTRSAVRSGAVGLLGFGMGGRLAFLAACRNPGDVTACVCFCAGGITDLESAPDLKASLLLLYGQLDTSISASDRETLRERLTALGKDFRIEILSGAGADFFDEEQDGYRVRASKLAWDETLALFRKRL